ncbi:MAG TPA: hypothetical protein VMG60_19405 [Burkholderiaceae bacterium]|nr:hypothetical protein [Burkholderiaceae bacterium]
MNWNRRKLLFASAGGSALAAVLAACGGGGYSPTPTPTPPPPPGALACHDTVITGNHGHAVTIPDADLDSMVDMTYNIQGTADHNHTIVLTVAQLQMIKVMTAVTVLSSTTLSHNHDVTVNCG